MESAVYCINLWGCLQVAREAALQQQLQAWRAQEAEREAAEAVERERRLRQEAEQASEWREAEAVKEAARRKERAAWAAVTAAETQRTALQVEAAQ